MAPFIVITLCLFFLYMSHQISSYDFVGLASIHAASCLGDFYFSYLVIRAPEKSYVEDTEQGINLYRSI